MSEGDQSHTGFSPSMTSCSKELRPEPTPKHPLQITTRALKEPDFKFELLPLHSPLLRQSLLVSFPPLIDMLKFSGYPCLIRGQPCEWVFRQTGPRLSKRKILLRLKPVPRRRAFRGTSSKWTSPNTKPGLSGEMTLEQACPSGYQGAQCAFKDSMIH